MKQSGIASFFGKPHGKGEAKAVAVEGEEPKQRQVLGDGNRGEKRSTEARKPGHASGGRLKRLKKSGSKTRDENREESDYQLAADLEDISDPEPPQICKHQDLEQPHQAANLQETPDVAEQPADAPTEGSGRSEPIPLHPMFAPKPKGGAKVSVGSDKPKGGKGDVDATAAVKQQCAKTEQQADGAEGSKGENKGSEEGKGGKCEDKKAVHPFFAKKPEAPGTSAGVSATQAFEAVIQATAGKAKGIKTSTMDGVGVAALAAAEQHKKFSKESYLFWKEGAATPYSFMAEAFEVIASTTKRQEKASVLIEAFRTILASNPADLIAAVRLTANELSPPHEGLELGLGEATLKDVLAEVSGRTKGAIDKMYQEIGDLGSLAVEVRSKVRILVSPARLTVVSVLKSLQEIARIEGAKAVNRKKNIISKLMVASSGNEAGYILRACEFKRGLRIGVNDSTLLTALAHAVHLHKLGSKAPDLADKLEETAQAVRQAFCECPSYEVLINAMLEHDLDELQDHCHFIVGVPVKPMLAKPTLGVSEVLDKFSGCEFTCEYKYDGERAQIHVLEDGSVQVYSRNSENSLGKYPDAAEIVKKHLKPGIKGIVIDSEVVAYDRKAGRIKPFQELSRRPKKVASISDIKCDLCVYPFDCLYANGEILLRKPLAERRKALHDSMVETKGECQFAQGKTSSDMEVLQAFLEEAVSDCTEGLMVKAMDATYEPSKRSTNWLKLKKDYMDGAADSFDVVPIGAWYGKGKRTGVYGSFLLAIYNPATEEFQTISKIGTGFSEEVLEAHARKLRELEIPAPRSYYRYGDSSAMRPEVWFDAKVVWEVKAADLSISPIHQAAKGMVDPGKGISIRFPRLVRERDDKNPEDATTAEQVVEMYRKQAVAMADASKPTDDDDADM